MKALLITLVAAAALMIPTAALAHNTSPVPVYTPGVYCAGGLTVTAANPIQDLLLGVVSSPFAVSHNLNKVSTDVTFGPTKPYGIADNDADDVFVFRGACAVKPAVQTSSAYMCPKIADTQTVPQLVAAADVVRSFAAGMYSPTAFPGATVAVNPRTGYNADSYPTVIGTAKTPYTLRCGFGYGGLWWTDYMGELTNVKSFGNTTVGEYPIR